MNKRGRVACQEHAVINEFTGIHTKQTGPAHKLAVGLIPVGLAVSAVSGRTMNRPRTTNCFGIPSFRGQSPSPLSTSHISDYTFVG
jgi:hypothetical protein